MEIRDQAAVFLDWVARETMTSTTAAEQGSGHGERCRHDTEVAAGEQKVVDGRVLLAVEQA